MKRRTSTVKKTETGAKMVGATTDKETVHYASGAVQMGPNVAYEAVEYPEENIYEHPK